MQALQGRAAMAIYRQALALVREASEQYRDELISEETLQYRLMTAASIICALEEKELRRYPENLESRIELVRFTKNRIYDEVMCIVREVESEIARWEGQSQPR
jgi:hypothetical protein